MSQNGNCLGVRSTVTAFAYARRKSKTSPDPAEDFKLTHYPKIGLCPDWPPCSRDGSTLVLLGRECSMPFLFVRYAAIFCGVAFLLALCAELAFWLALA